MITFLISYYLSHFFYRNQNVNLDEWHILSGATKLDLNDSGHNISSIVPYPNARFNQFLYDNDVALVEVAGALTFSPTVGSVCLPANEGEENDICVTAGWTVKLESGM